jgi:hypothetical protein
VFPALPRPATAGAASPLAISTVTEGTTSRSALGEAVGSTDSGAGLSTSSMVQRQTRGGGSQAWTQATNRVPAPRSHGPHHRMRSGRARDRHGGPVEPISPSACHVRQRQDRGRDGQRSLRKHGLRATGAQGWTQG